MNQATHPPIIRKSRGGTLLAMLLRQRWSIIATASLALASCATAGVDANAAVLKGCAAIQVFKYYSDCSGLAAHDVEGAWDVYRDAPEVALGVFPHAVISKKDGRVLNVYVIE